MQVIKKYANRKLYHTNCKRYITLDGIARLVQEDTAIRVVDNETGEDITAVILAQIVLQSRGRNGVLPTTVLTSLIQMGGDALASLRQALFASLGGQDLIENEIGRRIDRLIDKGAFSADEGMRLRRLLLRQDLSDMPIDAAQFTGIEIPSRNDVVMLHSQIDALSEIVDQLLDQKT